MSKLVAAVATLLMCLGMEGVWAQEPLVRVHPSDGRYILQILAVRDGCSPANQLYKIHNDDPKNQINLKVCKQSFKPGQAVTRSFRNYSLKPKQDLKLGCDVDVEDAPGTIRQSFSIHWQQADPRQPPTDIINAANSIEAFHFEQSCGGSGCAWMIGNWHNFKPISVTWSYLNRQWTQTLRPQEIMPASGFSISAPKIEQAIYLGNSNDAYCITNGDNYPLIPVTGAP
jgi:hypothetical protein